MQEEAEEEVDGGIVLSMTHPLLSFARCEERSERGFEIIGRTSEQTEGEVEREGEVVRRRTTVEDVEDDVEDDEEDHWDDDVDEEDHMNYWDPSDNGVPRGSNRDADRAEDRKDEGPGDNGGQKQLWLTFAMLKEAMPELVKGWEMADEDELLLSEEDVDENDLRSAWTYAESRPEEFAGRRTTKERMEEHWGPVLSAFAAKKYKKVANRVKPLLADLPEEFRIVRRKHPNPLEDLPDVPVHPPKVVPGVRFNQERHDKMKERMVEQGFLQEEEIDLVLHMFMAHEKVFAWDESEKGHLDPEYFDPILIPTVPHRPWVIKNVKIPPGLLDRIIDVIKAKIAAGVYEPSNASYRSPWFTVLKKDGTSLRLVHNLQPLNVVAIRDNAVPPFTDQLAESFGGRACYGMFDLFVAFDQRTLDPRSRDLTTFQTPLGTFRTTCIPMGYTNSVQIMHNDITFILQDYIPHITHPYIDDVPTKGPKTRYVNPDGSYETIPGNPRIRRFVYEHISNTNHVVHLCGKYGLTISGWKSDWCAAEATIVGHRCTMDGRVVEESRVAKVVDWPTPKTATNVRGFLGTAGVARIFIENFSQIARPLTRLTRKDVDFEWGDREEEAFVMLKKKLADSPALRPLDYTAHRSVILAVDSSDIGVGYIIFQIGEDNKRYPNRFGSINWNARESRYSQAKLELYGLARALHATKIYIIGVWHLIIEMDAYYVLGMINNPDIVPGAAANRWIAGILLFDFELRHVPAAKHGGPDGLSREPGEHDDGQDLKEMDEWIDRQYGFILVVESHSCLLANDDQPQIPRSERALATEARLDDVRGVLTELRFPPGISSEDRVKLAKFVSNFFMRNGRLWHKSRDGRVQLVPKPEARFDLLRQAHDDLGHKGVFSTRSKLLDRFWWPGIDDDIKWYIQSCHPCQVRQMTHLHIPPTVSIPATLLRKLFTDSMLMPRANNYRYIIQARCSLTSWPEFRLLRTETGRTIGEFIFQDILCRWGAVAEIVTDNGPAFIAALEYLSETYKINHIRISPYNSQANGPVERRHLDVREAIMKTAQGIESAWPKVAHAVFWAERVTTQRSTGHSPYFMVHGVEPVLPFDLAEATYMVPAIDAPISEAELLAIRGRQLMMRQEDLDAVEERVLKARFRAVKEFEKKFENTTRDYNFKPGAMVLVRNTRVEKELNRKTKPRYLGPMVVLRRTKGGSYLLAEVDGAISKSRFAAFRLIPYHARSDASQPPEQVTRLSEDELDGLADELDTNGAPDEVPSEVPFDALFMGRLF